MKLKKIIIGSFLMISVPFMSHAQSSKYKCMIQMSSYMGDGAYIAVSLINSKGDYEKTLYIIGDDDKWYNSLKDWYKFYKKNKTNLSAVTGASISGGDRTVKVIEIDDSKINTGYKLRFESAVEDHKYNEKDAEIALTTAGLAGKADGTGYIKYVKLSKIAK
jgi:hypothetical protein